MLAYYVSEQRIWHSWDETPPVPSTAMGEICPSLLGGIMGEDELKIIAQWLKETIHYELPFTKRCFLQIDSSTTLVVEKNTVQGEIVGFRTRIIINDKSIPIYGNSEFTYKNDEDTVIEKTLQFLKSFMEYEKFISEVFKHNGWISGRYAYEDGDIMAIVNYREEFSNFVEAKNLHELYEWCKRGHLGTFVWKNIVIFNHPVDFGTFVYRMPNAKNYEEHLTVNAMTFKEFADIIQRISEGTYRDK